MTSSGNRKVPFLAFPLSKTYFLFWELYCLSSGCTSLSTLLSPYSQLCPLPRCPSITALCCIVMSPYPLLVSHSVTRMACCTTAKNKCCAGLSQMRRDSAGSPGLFIALQLSPIFGSISISIATNCDVKATWFFGENSRKQ